MKKNISLMIILILVFEIVFPILSIATEDSNTIYIGKEEELWDFAESVNSGENYSGKIIKLTNDIILNCTEEKTWIPIGNDDTSFKGTFDGCGFTISGMHIESTDYEYNGLFGLVESAIICNLTIEGTIEGTMSGDSSKIGSIVAKTSNSIIKNCISNVTISCVGNELRIGGIVGKTESDTIINNCINNGEINCETTGVSGTVGGICSYNGSSIIENCLNKGNIETKGVDYTGGVCGYNRSSTIENSLNKGNIETKGVGYTGGIVGYVYYVNANVKKCYNSGNIKLNSVPQGAGGIAGEANVGEFDSCYNVGEIQYVGKGTTNGTASIYKIGGIVGETYNDVSIKNCYNIGDTDMGGGIAGVISSDERQIIENNYYLEEKSDYGYYSSGIGDVGIVEKTSTEMKKEEFVDLLNNNTDNYKFDNNSYNNGYPILIWVTDIEIIETPRKLVYKQNKEELDLSGGKVKLLYNYNEYDTIVDMSDDSILVEGFDNSEEKEITLTVTYENRFYEYFNVSIVESIAPILSIEYSTTKATNGDVTATIISNEEIQEVDGWELSDDRMKLTKTYTANSEEIVEVYDLVGNSSTLEIEIKNIDKEAPKISASYNIEEITNQDVLVTITANEKIQEIEGWSLSEDKLKLTKTYTINGQESVEVYDIAGNKSNIEVRVQNIDKSNIELQVKYSTTQMTNKNVNVEVIANKEIQQVEGWTLSEDKTKITKTFTENGEEELTVYDKAGNSKSTKIEINNIDKKSPEINVTYSTYEKTNQDVLVTITANEKIQEIEGWSLSGDKLKLTKKYTINGQESVEVYDIAGNKSNIEVKVQNIDKSNIELQVKYSTTQITNKNVNVEVVANKEIQQVKGWTLSQDKTKITKTFTENGEEELIVYDKAGNSKSTKIEIKNIDKKLPEINLTYSTYEKTNQDVLVTITANEKIQGIEGWSLSEDKLKLTKTYTMNGQESVEVYDIAGNKSDIEIKVQNIDKTNIELQVKYSTTQMTNKNVNVEVVANKEIQQVKGWTLSQDKTKITKTFTENGEEELTVYDKAGNSQLTKIEIKNIDKKSPEFNVTYSTYEKTNQNVEVTIEVNEKVQEIEGWSLSEDEKILTKTYTLNGNEEINLYDMAGNTAKVHIQVNNIDKMPSEQDVKDDNTISTTVIPEAGTNKTIVVGIITVLIVAVVVGIKFSNLKDIK